MGLDVVERRVQISQNRFRRVSTRSRHRLKWRRATIRGRSSRRVADPRPARSRRGACPRNRTRNEEVPVLAQGGSLHLCTPLRAHPGDLLGEPAHQVGDHERSAHPAGAGGQRRAAELRAAPERPPVLPRDGQQLEVHDLHAAAAHPHPAPAGGADQLEARQREVQGPRPRARPLTFGDSRTADHLDDQGAAPEWNFDTSATVV